MNNPEKILKIGVDYWSSQVLLCAIELQIFTALAEGPLTLEEIIEEFNLNDRLARDFLDSLVALEFLQKDDIYYSNSSDSDYYLDKNKQSYLGSVLTLGQYQLWGSLIDKLTSIDSKELQTGGSNYYRELYKNSDIIEEYAKSMSTLNLGANISIAENFPWENVESIVDLGCSEGGLLLQILQRYRNIKGIGIDLPELKECFLTNMKNFSLENRAIFYAADFNNESIPSAEVFTVGHILHALSPNDRNRLLRKLYELLPIGGYVIIYEHIVDDDRSNNVFSLLMSINMQLESNGHGSLTGEDWTKVLNAIGFMEVYIEPLLGPSYMICGKKV